WFDLFSGRRPDLDQPKILQLKLSAAGRHQSASRLISTRPSKRNELDSLFRFWTQDVALTSAGHSPRRIEAGPLPTRAARLHHAWSSNWTTRYLLDPQLLG